jgi:hypothetical protein
MRARFLKDLLCDGRALEAVNPLSVLENVRENITNEKRVFNIEHHICTNRSVVIEDEHLQSLRHKRNLR